MSAEEVMNTPSSPCCYFAMMVLPLQVRSLHERGPTYKRDTFRPDIISDTLHMKQ